MTTTADLVANIESQTSDISRLVRDNATYLHEFEGFGLTETGLRSVVEKILPGIDYPPMDDILDAVALLIWAEVKENLQVSHQLSHVLNVVREEALKMEPKSEDSDWVSKFRKYVSDRRNKWDYVNYDYRPVEGYEDFPSVWYYGDYISDEDDENKTEHLLVTYFRHYFMLDNLNKITRKDFDDSLTTETCAEIIREVFSK